MDFAIEHALHVLTRTPATLESLLRGAPSEWTTATEGPDTFSPFDVVGHLIDGEETDWIPRARIILAQDPHLQFQPYDRFRHRTRNVGRSLDSLLTELSERRSANLDTVRSWNLTPQALALTGVHPSLGRVTLRELLATWTVHDLGHLAQVSRVMAKQYRQAVGPWSAFLPVLTDRDKPAS